MNIDLKSRFFRSELESEFEDHINNKNYRRGEDYYYSIFFDCVLASKPQGFGTFNPTIYKQKLFAFFDVAVERLENRCMSNIEMYFFIQNLAKEGVAAKSSRKRKMSEMEDIKEEQSEPTGKRPRVNIPKKKDTSQLLLKAVQTYCEEYDQAEWPVADQAIQAHLEGKLEKHCKLNDDNVLIATKNFRKGDIVGIYDGEILLNAEGELKMKKMTPDPEALNDLYYQSHVLTEPFQDFTIIPNEGNDWKNMKQIDEGKFNIKRTVHVYQKHPYIVLSATRNIKIGDEFIS